MLQIINSSTALHLTVSHNTLLRMRKQMTNTYDEEVQMWKKGMDVIVAQQFAQVNLICNPWMHVMTHYIY